MSMFFKIDLIVGLVLFYIYMAGITKRFLWPKYELASWTLDLAQTETVCASTWGRALWVCVSLGIGSGFVWALNAAAGQAPWPISIAVSLFFSACAGGILATLGGELMKFLPIISVLFWPVAWAGHLVVIPIYCGVVCPVFKSVWRLGLGTFKAGTGKETD